MGFSRASVYMKLMQSLETMRCSWRMSYNRWERWFVSRVWPPGRAEHRQSGCKSQDTVSMLRGMLQVFVDNLSRENDQEYAIAQRCSPVGWLSARSKCFHVRCWSPTAKGNSIQTLKRPVHPYTVMISVYRQIYDQKRSKHALPRLGRSP